MENRTVIITGGNGFVGKHLIGELQQSGFASRIIIFDKYINGLPVGVEAHDVDITDIASTQDIIREAKPSWVVHLAAIANVGFSIERPDITRTINVFATKALLDVVLQQSPETKFLIISSADIYGHVSVEPLIELPLQNAHPTNPYAQSKYEMEQMIEKDYNTHCIRVRPFPHIGPGQQKGFVTADFASQIAAIESGVQEPVISVGNLTAQRDFTDVRDVVRSYRLLMEHGTVGDVYHVASGVARSIESVLNQLLAFSSVSITIEQDSARMRPSDNPVLVGNANKLKNATGWDVTIPFDQSLRDILMGFRKEYTDHTM